MTPSASARSSSRPVFGVNTIFKRQFVPNSLVAISFVISAYGCAFSVEYPEDWAQIASPPTAQACAPIEADYAQHGTTGQNTGPFWDRAVEMRTSLLSELIGIDVQPSNAVTHVSMRLSDSDPGLHAWIGKELLVAHDFAADELSCESGLWRLDLDTNFAGGRSLTPDVVGRFTRMYLYQAEDDSLAIKKIDKMVGVVFLLPFYARDQDWHRFLPATEREKQPAANAPHGVIPPGSPYARLLPPPNLKHRDDNTRMQNSCLREAKRYFDAIGGTLTADETARLQGRDTQAFLAQNSSSGNPYTRFEWLDRARGHTPSTRSAVLRKPHWLDTNIADRYVLCLYDAGYIWQDVTRSAE